MARGGVRFCQKRLARKNTMVMTHKAAPKVSLLGLFVTTLVIARPGPSSCPALALPPDEDEVKAKTAHVKVYQLAPTAGVQKAGSAPAAKSEGSGVSFFGEAPALEAMKGHGQATQPEPPTPPAAPDARPRLQRPQSRRRPPAPRPPRSIVALRTVHPAQRAATSRSDLEALKEGRTAAADTSSPRASSKPSTA